MSEDVAGTAFAAGGGSGTDPTANVLALVAAETKRQDDLRVMSAKCSDEVSLLTKAHLTEIANLRADFGEKLRDAESKRIDAIRAVDVGAVNRAAEVSATQASTLASQVATSAETLRTQVAAAATAAASSLAAALEPIIKDIADLRRVQYEQVGQKAQVTESRGSNGLLVAALGLGVTILIALFTVAAFVIARSGA